MRQLPELLSAVALVGSWSAASYEQLLTFYHQTLGLDERINAALENKAPQWPQLRQQLVGFFRAWAGAIQQALRQA